jgi:hypothetical protein
MHAKFEDCLKILWGMEWRGVDYQTWTLIKFQYNVFSHLIMVSFNYFKMSWYPLSGHNALDYVMSFIAFYWITLTC